MQFCHVLVLLSCNCLMPDQRTAVQQAWQYPTHKNVQFLWLLIWPQQDRTGMDLDIQVETNFATALWHPLIPQTVGTHRCVWHCTCCTLHARHPTALVISSTLVWSLNFLAAQATSHHDAHIQNVDLCCQNSCSTQLVDVVPTCGIFCWSAGPHSSW